jgi:transcriptional regulator with XRE-family HTH domain
MTEDTRTAGDDPALDGEVAALLAAMREECGVSQEALAMELGHDQSYVSRLETGQRRVTVADLLHFTAGLGVPFQRLASELETIWVRHVSTESIWSKERP